MDNQAPILLDIANAMGTGKVTAMSTDASGNVFILADDGAILARYDAALTQTWRVDRMITAHPRIGQFVDLPLRAMALTKDGDIVVTGHVGPDYAIMGETMVGSNDVVVGKFSSTGVLSWMHQWGSALADEGHFVAAAPDGSLVASGLSIGQVPGNPPDSLGGPWVTSYKADGTRSWLKQAMGSSSNGIAVDKDGNIYAGERERIRKLRPDGTELWRLAPTPNPAQPLPLFGQIALSPTGDVAYFWGAASAYQFPALSAVDASGKFLWYRSPGTRMATIDPAEGVIWNGRFLTGSTIAVSGDAIYIGGNYVNSYQNGSVPKPTTYPGFLARYDLQGNQVWFTEYVITTPRISPLAPVAVYPGPIAFDANGNLLVAVMPASIGFAASDGRSAPYSVGWLLLRLKAADGSRL